MTDIRCNNCNQLLLKANICVGEIKCPRCKKTILINVQEDRVSNTALKKS